MSELCQLRGCDIDSPPIACASAWFGVTADKTVTVHQPLHAGFADDRWGNSHKLQAFGRGTTLHAL